jgi:hypothetical protein
MNEAHQEALVLLEETRVPFAPRYRAARLIAQELRRGTLDKTDLPLFYHALVGFWRELGVREADRADARLFAIRKALAEVSAELSRRVFGDRRFYAGFPSLPRVEGPDNEVPGAVRRGALRCTYGTSLYEFHLEYPIDGFGVRKDLISVIADDGARWPIFDWCKTHGIIVFCNRCWLDITCEVSRDCPWRKAKYGAGRGDSG